MAPSAIHDDYRYSPRPSGKAQIQATVLVGPKNLKLVRTQRAFPPCVVVIPAQAGHPPKLPYRAQRPCVTKAHATTLQEPRTIHPPGPHELQIEVKATGICGSDVSYYNKYRNGDLQVTGPLTLGHESAGVVVAIGEQVTGFAINDRVALEVGVPCDNCRACQRGRYNLCPKMRFRSSAKSVPHYQGTLQERINHPAKWCHK